MVIVLATGSGSYNVVGPDNANGTFSGNANTTTTGSDDLPPHTATKGSDTAHNNMPPYLAVRYIIKAKPYTRAAIIDGVDLPYSNLLVRSTDSNSLRSELLSGASGGDLVFYTNSGEASKTGTERMRLTAGGTLGIGVASGFGSTYSVQIAGNVNTNGTVVMANPFMFRNRIINGNMRINQRYGLTGGGMDPNSTDPPTTGGVNWTQVQNTRTYTCDRWATHATDTGNKMSQLTWGTFVADEANIPVGFKNYLRIKRNTTAVTEANGDWFAIVQPIEGDNILDLGWNRGTVTGAQSATVSFWVRSSVTGKFAFGVQQQHPGATPYTVYNTSYTINQANKWEYKTITIPPNTTGVKGFSNLYVYFMMGKNLSASPVAPNTWTTTNTQSTTETIDGMVSTANSSWDITGVQFEVGTVATPFEQRPLSVEQSLCERYYEKSYELDTKPGTFTNRGNSNRRYVLMSANNQEFDYIRFRVTKRTRSSDRSVWTAGTVTGEAGITTKDYVWVSDGSKVAANYNSAEDSINDIYVGFYLGGRATGVAVAFNWAIDAEV